MQLHNILITGNTPLPATLVLSQSDSVIELKGGDLISRLAEFLSSTALPRGTGINLVLDQTFIRYYYISLPLISARKIRNVLQFELEDTLLRGSEEYVYSYFSQSDRKSGVTETGVFIIEKQLMDTLIALFKEFSLEVKWITSLEHIMSLNHREKLKKPMNSVVIEIIDDTGAVRFFVYQNGFLTNISSQNAFTGDSSLRDADESLHIVGRINQKLNAIRLSNDDLDDIILSGNSDGQFQLVNHQLVAKPGNEKHSVNSETEFGFIEHKLQFDHPRRINLTKSNILFLQELKKYGRTLMAIGGILLLGLVLYIGAIAFRSYNDQLTAKSLDKQLTVTIAKYLPRGTSKTNALQILQERVREMELKKEETSQFEHQLRTLLSFSHLLRTSGTGVVDTM